MSHSIHHVPGRIRVRSSSIKRNDKEAQAVQDFLGTIRGVSAVSVSTVTGSITINHDAQMVSSTAILDALRQQHHFNWEVAAATNSTPSQSSAAKAGEIFGKAVFGVLVEKVLERSAIALIAAIV